MGGSLVSVNLTDEELARLNQCTSCGDCLVECPIFKATGESMHLPLAKAKVLRHIVERTEGMVSHFFGPQPVEEYALKRAVPRVFECTLCGACTRQCEFEIRPHELWYSFRRVMDEAHYLPEALREAVPKFVEAKNPYGLSPEMRLYWIKRARIEDQVPIGNNSKVLYFPGCTTAFKGVNRPIAVAMTRILNKANEDWSILGEEEWCCGAPWLMIGDEERARELAKHNVELIESLGSKLVVTGCPTCYRHMAQEYKALLGRKPDFQVVHVVQLIRDYLESGRIGVKKGSFGATYHDPCELARNSGVVEEPRLIMSALTSKFAELEKRGEDTLCCGGGGLLRATNEGISLKVAQIRASQAAEKGVEYLVSACPSCKMLLTDGADALKAELRVVDILELVAQNLID